MLLLGDYTDSQLSTKDNFLTMTAKVFILFYIIKTLLISCY